MTLLWIILKVGLKSLWANKMRSVLAMLGIIMGVAAVISMLALGEGAQKQLLDNMSTMGSNLLVVMPAQRGSGGVVSGVQQNLTVEDAAVLAQVPGVRQVAPVVNQRAQVKYANRNMQSSVIGSTPTYLPIRNFQIDKGRCFTDGQVDASQRVAVLGSATAEQLFGYNDPVGEIIKVNGVNFTVVGVTKPKGNAGFFNPDEVVIVPYGVAMRQLFGLRNLREINVQAEDDDSQAKLKDEVAAALRKRHRISPGAPDDFTVGTQEEMLKARMDTVNTFRNLLAGVAAVSLLVGGIGIMNIMLVTVTERTREIGIRKAVGAKERHILWQFLLESVIISGLGGLLGAALGFGGAWGVPKVVPMETVVTTQSVMISLSFAALVGVFFGFYPAWRAAMLDPVEALRYE